jgi:hypothetical protein
MPTVTRMNTLRGPIQTGFLGDLLARSSLI